MPTKKPKRIWIQFVQWCPKKRKHKNEDAGEREPCRFINAATIISIFKTKQKKQVRLDKQNEEKHTNNYWRSFNQQQTNCDVMTDSVNWMERSALVIVSNSLYIETKFKLIPWRAIRSDQLRIEWKRKQEYPDWSNHVNWSSESCITVSIASVEEKVPSCRQNRKRNKSMAKVHGKPKALTSAAAARHKNQAKNEVHAHKVSVSKQS